MNSYKENIKLYATKLYHELYNTKETDWEMVTVYSDNISYYTNLLIQETPVQGIDFTQLAGVDFSLSLSQLDDLGIRPRGNQN
jgi:hypothetical protein